MKKGMQEMKTVKGTAPVICEQCGKVFQAKYAFFCPECILKMKSERAKRIGLNRIGNEAYSKQQSEIKAERNENYGRQRD